MVKVKKVVKLAHLKLFMFSKTHFAILLSLRSFRYVSNQIAYIKIYYILLKVI